MADLKSTIVNGKLRVTSDANVSGNLEGATISENGTQLSSKYYLASNPSGYGTGTVKKVNNTSPDSNGNVTITIPSDTNQTVKTSSVTFGSNDAVQITAGSNVTVTGDASAKTITIASSYSNTATAADNILDGSNNGTQITYAPYSSQQSKLSFDTSSTTPTRTDRLNLNGKFYATEVYAGSTKLTGNTGTVTSVSAGTGLSISGTASTTPTVNVASGYKLPTTSEWNSKQDSVEVVDGYTTQWLAKEWSTLTSFLGDSVWTDGNNIYYSRGSNQYVLNANRDGWVTKSWTGAVTDLYGACIWTDGNTIYYSNLGSQCVWDATNTTWVTKSWGSYVPDVGYDVWTDGINTYYSNGITQYVLNKATATWSIKTWTGLTNFDGNDVWTDGENIYYSLNGNNYILNKSTSTWTAKTWTGLTSFRGDYVWTDGENIYYSSTTSHYVLNKATSTWSSKTWVTLTNFNGGYIWNDGVNIYYSYNDKQMRLWPFSHNTQYISKVAETGSFNDLIDKPNAETWTFTLSDNTTVTKTIYIK